MILQMSFDNMPQAAKVKTVSIHFSSESSEWYTPAHIVDLVLLVLGRIDLDPCSDSETTPNIPAALHYTQIENGLQQNWHGKVFVNPPYGSELRHWVAKTIHEYQQGRAAEVILLVPSRTDTKWFQSLRQYPRCFLWGRLRFNNVNSAPFPSMIVYLGSNPNRFASVFSTVGDIYARCNEWR